MKEGFLLRMFHYNIPKKESQYLLNITIMDLTWRKQSMISTQKLYKEKSMPTTDKYAVETSFNLKNPHRISCILSFIQIYLIFLEIFKELLMR